MHPTCCLQESGSPPMKPELMLDIFHNINRTEIKLAALFDVLTSQCDRHQQNIFITKDRQMRVIDNDQVRGGRVGEERGGVGECPPQRHTTAVDLQVQFVTDELHG